MPGIIQKLGSFPNSQIKPRSPVRDSDTNEIAVVAAPGNTQILAINAARIKAIIKNSGANPIEYAYSAADLTAGEGFELSAGSAITIDGGGNNVFARGVGGASSVEIDDRLG